MFESWRCLTADLLALAAIEFARPIAYHPRPVASTSRLCLAASKRDACSTIMIDYDVQRCSRRCCATERELKDGESCFSVLVAEGGAVVRRDYSAEAWQGPPENAIGWWKTTIVDPNAGRPHWAPNDVMLNYFERLLGDPAAENRPAAEDARYVLALLLVRRRVLRVEGHEQDATGRPTLLLYCARNEAQYRVAEVMPSPERAAAIQQQLSDLLQTHGRTPAATEGDRNGSNR